MASLLYKLYRVKKHPYVDYVYITKPGIFVFCDSLVEYKSESAWHSHIHAFFNGAPRFHSFTKCKIEMLLTHRNPEYREWARRKLEKRNGKSSL